MTFALALGAGVIAQTLAHHLRLPGIVVFLAAGVLLGPDILDVVRPEALGRGLDTLVGLAVSLILFEGGLNLNVGRLRREATTIRRLVTIGAVVTALGATLAAKLMMQWDWPTSVLFGTLVIVTGPTVINPLLRRIRVTQRLRTILEAEGVLIDPIGAVIAVVTLEVILSGTATSAALGLLGIPVRLLVGLLVGAAGGFAIAFLLRRDDLIPDEIHNVFVLALVLTLYAISEAIVTQSGILAAPVAGIVVGNSDTRLHAELMEFKEQLTIMLVAMLFVLLAADVRLLEVTALGWRGIGTIALLVFVVRPLDVAVCTYGSDLSTKERLFVAWLGPRGIVAAAVASLFARQLEVAGLGNGLELRALVFMVIAVTVLLQGLTGGPLASALSVRRRTKVGYAVVGANSLGRAFGRTLVDAGHEVVLIDSNPRQASLAESEGLSVILGNANDERTLLRADVEGRRGVVMITENENANVLIAERVRGLSRSPQRYVCLARGGGVPKKRVAQEGHLVLFGRPIDVNLWSRALRDGALVERWRFDGDDEDAATALMLGPDPADARLLALVVEQKKGASPVDDHTTVRRGDVVVVLVPGQQVEHVAARLREGGWSRVGAPTPTAQPAGAPSA
ncbi:MAG: cation:proton antiporter [Gemmatimonadales bacterium]